MQQEFLMEDQNLNIGFNEHFKYIIQLGIKHRSKNNGDKLRKKWVFLKQHDLLSNNHSMYCRAIKGLAQDETNIRANMNTIYE